MGWQRQRNTYRLADAVSSISLACSARPARCSPACCASASTPPCSNTWRCGATMRSGSACPAGCWRWCSTTLLLLAAPHGARVGRAVGRARGAPPEPGLQPQHRAAPDQFGALLAGSLCAHGAGRRAALVFGVVALIDLLYQFWVHTEQVGKPGLVRPLVLQPQQPPRAPCRERRLPGQKLRRHPDPVGRMFGTFKDEDAHEKCVYGTRGLLNSWDRCGPTPRCTPGWRTTAGTRAAGLDKLKVWIKPPGWRPADVAERFPKPAFSMAQMQLTTHPCRVPCSGLRWCSSRLLLTGVAPFVAGRCTLHWRTTPSGLPCC